MVQRALPSDVATQAMTSVAPGDRIGKYELIEQLGAGGSTVVWKARDPVLDRVLAVKQFAQGRVRDGGELEDSSAAERRRLGFERLRQACDAHKRLVRLFELAEHPSGLFVAMEYVEGRSLEQAFIADPKPLKNQQVLRFVQTIGHVLAALHSQGIVHGNLKPSNILLTPGSEDGGFGGGLKVCDFGLATLLDEQDMADPMAVRYMAPEQLRGGPADVQSDIYSLGMMTYEMLAGREKFEQVFRVVLRDPRSAALRWMKWHTNVKAVATPLAKVNPHISERLGDLVARMMEKDPVNRIASAEQLLEALHRHFGGPPGTPPRDDSSPEASGGETSGGVSERSRTSHGQAATRLAASQSLAIAASGDPTAKLPQQRRWPRVLAGVLVVVPLLVGSVMWFSHASDARRVAAMQRQEVAALLKDAWQAYTSNDFAEAQRLYQQAERLPGAVARSGSGVASGDNSGGGDTSGGRIRGGLLLTQASIDMAEGRYTAALESLRELDEMRVVKPELVQRLIREASQGGAFHTEVAIVEEHLKHGRIAQARARLMEQRRLKLTLEEEQVVSALLQKADVSDRERQIEELLAKANQLEAQGERAAAIKLLSENADKHRSERVNSLLQELGRKKRFAEAIAEAKDAEKVGDLKSAIERYTAALAIEENAEVQATVRQLRGALELRVARLLQQEGDLPGAVAALKRSIEASENTEAKAMLARIQAADLRLSLVESGDRAALARSYDVAVKHYEKAAAMQSDPALVAKLLSAKLRLEVQRGQTFLEADKLPEARAAFEQALRMDSTFAEAVAGMKAVNLHTDYRKALAAGDIHRDAGRHGAAKREYLAAKEIRDTQEINERLDEAEYQYLIAQARQYMEVNQWASARAMLSSASKLRNTDEIKKLLARIPEK